ncbi:4-(cytidine 5'-diphospho)-2-C-methyl-D-erythritol kinase [Pontivivens insulae]|uniref:4-diphosphocytidyl-2-C-methyl-D-erythritol kinase n=1 Tax=Pontivivens insulae TaxID=1639689 RepID=A0A2R8A9A6_9RHOB|nr:4-(cytidine 5'-diphospho)-2-C-methyl-D-erythritol kinase [Pontivivens insulae]RED12705.1 4-diphosphocytidyl-2-C-methyl-D-erythritol kinase [Pontivivens insulae]SPF28796.1 4-diphosphocytidyl-2-C-methyl-D-erythritol kinase [Pontivivens insulae]
MKPISELARAKVNLSLHVTGRRPDGYHMLDSLVVFAEIGDRIEVEPSSTLSLTLDGPFALGLAADEDNLVLRTARKLRAGGTAAIHLQKNLPVASGIGGGSADAAGALRALARHWDVPLPEADGVAALGADVPVCMMSRTRRMRGIGDRLEAVPTLPPAWLVLVNPGVAVSTPQIFKSLESVHNPAMNLPDRFGGFGGFIDWLQAQRNDMQAAAIRQAPVIEDVLWALSSAPLARMSGSGATCFALVPDQQAALGLADLVRESHPTWWVAAAPIRD